MIGKDEAHFVLVHGIGGGAWCWYKLRCLLENSGGCKVTCLDLKASGVDPADANSVLSFDDYNKPLIDFLASLPHNQQASLIFKFLIQFFVCFN
nr:methylesterase 17 [Ipomoea batatas]